MFFAIESKSFKLKLTESTEKLSNYDKIKWKSMPIPNHIFKNRLSIRKSGAKIGLFSIRNWRELSMILAKKLLKISTHLSKW